MNEHTNFDNYSHAELRRMVGSMDSGGVMSAADPWRRATVALKQIHNSLATSTSDATSTWEGDTSDAFESKMTVLADRVRYVAAYTNDAALTLEMMSSAIAEAKSTMPEEPGFWSKAADAVGDTASSAMGNEDEDTKTAITDEKKAQAVAVMNLLATRYRAASDYLKPPPKRIEDMKEIVSSDSMGTAAFSAMIMGGGMGFASSQSSGTATLRSRTSGPTGTAGVQSPKSVPPSRPTDPGIKGGTANPMPKPPSPNPYGPGTGIDGATVAPKPGTYGPGSQGISGPGAGGGGGGIGSSSGNGSNTFGGGQLNATKNGGGQFGAAGVGGPSGNSARGGGSGIGQGAGGAGRGGGAFGAGGMQGGGASAGGLGGGQAGRAGAGAGRMGGGTVGGSVGGAGGRGAFTEGGSGLGRGRGQAGQGAAGQGGGMHGANSAGKKKDEKEKRRPDYLVEDEETWASGKPSNPNVVD
ncbi:WXG100 family type VII secretion target [Kitasatospora sp. NPDC004289]